MTNHKCPTDCRENLIEKIDSKLRKDMIWKFVASILGVAVILLMAFWNGYTASQKDAAGERKENSRTITQNEKGIAIIKIELLTLKKGQDAMDTQLLNIFRELQKLNARRHDEP